jgi:AbrB family looped-hinge helix DNA binding protein
LGWPAQRFGTQAMIGQVRILRVRVRAAMKITSKGQVTIPQALRERFGLLPNTEVEFVATANGLRLVKSSNRSNRGRALVERLRQRGTGKRSTDELLKLMRSDA